MGREEGGGENATPLEHLAPSKPCSTLSKPAVGSLPWHAALLPSPPPLSGPEPSPESAFSFLLGGGVGVGPLPAQGWETSFRTAGSSPPLLWARGNAQPEKNRGCKALCLFLTTWRSMTSALGLKPSPPSTSPVERCRNQVPGAEDRRPSCGNLIYATSRTGVLWPHRGPQSPPRVRGEQGSGKGWERPAELRRQPGSATAPLPLS